MKKIINNFRRYFPLYKELVIKGVKLKYRRSYLGIAWSMIEPLLTMIVLSVVFINMLGRGGGKYDPSIFPIYVLSGRLFQGFFGSSTKAGMRSVASHLGMIKKVYVPKYLYPMASVTFNYIIFLLSLPVLIIVALILGAPVFTWNIFQLIFPLISIFIMSLGTALILSTVCVFFKDIEYMWDVIVMIIMYLSAIFYYPEDIGQWWIEKIIYLNPIYSVIANVRHIVMDGASIFTDTTTVSFGGITFDNMQLFFMGNSFVWSAVLLVIGIFVFKRNQDKFIYHL